MNKNLLAIFIFVFIASVIYFSIELGKVFSEIFYDITVGLGALFASVGGLKLFSDWLRENAMRKTIEDLKKLYPRKSLNQSFRLIRSNITGNKIYVHMRVDNRRYWIMNSQTFMDMDFAWGEEINISDSEMEKISEGEGIITRGTPGT